MTAVTSTDAGTRPDVCPPTRWLRPATLVVLGLTAIAMLAFVLVGRINADEGWYLYAGRLAWRFELPYRDFSFTQMPLMPYVYGPFQQIFPSLVLGRVLSVVLGFGGIVLCVRAARRLGGDWAAFAVAVLCAGFTTGLYNLALSKTYALVLLCFAATLAALTSRLPPSRAWPLACVAAWAATFARTSSLPLTVLVVGYCLWRAPDLTTRRRVGGVGVVGAVVAAGFLLASPTNARFDLFTFHQLLWYRASSATRLDKIVTDRLPEWAGDYPIALAVLVAAIVVGLTVSRIRETLRTQPAPVIVGLGAIGYLVLQLPAGQFAPVEYATPMVPVVFAVSIPVLVRAFGTRVDRASTRSWLAIAGLGLVAVFGALHPAPWNDVVRPGGAGGILHQEDLASLLRDRTRPDDEVLAMWAQPIVLASGRDFTPDVTLGPFSYEDLTSARAHQLHYVNARLLRRLLEARRPGAVVLTDIDRLVLHFQGTLSQDRADARLVFDALAANYRCVDTSTTWGIDGPVGLEIYLRRGKTRP